MYTQRYLGMSPSVADLICPRPRSQWEAEDTRGRDPILFEDSGVNTNMVWEHFNRVKAQDEERRRNFQKLLDSRPSPIRSIYPDKEEGGFSSHYAAKAGHKMPGSSLTSETRNRVARNVESRQPDPSRLGPRGSVSNVSKHYGYSSRSDSGSGRGERRSSSAYTPPAYATVSSSLFPSDPNWYVVRATQDGKKPTEIVSVSGGSGSRPMSSLAVMSNDRSGSRARSVCRSGAENEKSDYFTDTNYPESFFQNSTAVEKMLKDPDAAAKLS